MSVGNCVVASKIAFPLKVYNQLGMNIFLSGNVNKTVTFFQSRSLMLSVEQFENRLQCVY